MPEEQDYYTVLGVPRTADPAELKRALQRSGRRSRGYHSVEHLDAFWAGVALTFVAEVFFLRSERETETTKTKKTFIYHPIAYTAIVICGSRLRACACACGYIGFP